MKTKLLKIIRNRYEIRYYTHIDNPDHILYDNSFPLYTLYDNNADKYISSSINYDNIYNNLVDIIHEAYYRTKKDKVKLSKFTKVWHKI